MATSYQQSPSVSDLVYQTSGPTTRERTAAAYVFAALRIVVG
jgi:hypothetical protein